MKGGVIFSSTVLRLDVTLLAGGGIEGFGAGWFINDTTSGKKYMVFKSWMNDGRLWCEAELLEDDFRLPKLNVLTIERIA